MAKNNLNNKFFTADENSFPSSSTSDCSSINISVKDPQTGLYGTDTNQEQKCNNTPGCFAYVGDKMSPPNCITGQKGVPCSPVTNPDNTFCKQSEICKTDSTTNIPWVYCAPNPSTTPSSNSEYTLTANFDQSSYNVGDPIQFCFNLSPTGTPFEAVVTQTAPTNQQLFDQTADGLSYPYCINETVKDTDAPTITLHVDAIISGQTVASVDESVPVNSSGNSTTATPTDTATPTTSTPSDTVTPTTTTQPTDTTSPTQTQSDTTLSISASLLGISSDPKDNHNPTRITRSATLQLFDSSNNQVGQDITGNLTFDSSNYDYTGSFDLGSSFTTGNYTAKVKLDNTLYGSYSTPITITSGNQKNAITQPIQLISGDMNQDGTLDISDWTAYVACYQGLSSCTDAQKTLADFNDDGKVVGDATDLTIIQRGFKEANNQ